MEELDSLSPLDGRYSKIIEPLTKFFSEKSLMQYRIKVEAEYLIALSEIDVTRKFTEIEKIILRSLQYLLNPQAEIIKKIEKEGYNNIKATNHDVKAIEYYMKEQLKNTSLDDCLEKIHFGLTSEDVNNMAYSLMLSDALEKVMIPKLEDLMDSLLMFSQKYKSLPMLARTHGQPASPTTLGKEFKVYYSRLENQWRQLNSCWITAKLNGATGNYNALHFAYPKIDWICFSNKFINSFNDKRKIKLCPNNHTTQIESHDSYAELFDNLNRTNTILIGLSQDMWRYISDGWLVQKPKDGEIGSSTMPHKVNPIDFENSEGNLSMANALFSFFSSKLPISRLQRDLSDSTVLRNIGSAFGYSLIGYSSLTKGFSKIAPDENKIKEELNNHPEIISEGIQTILRREGCTKPYEQLMQLTRGKKVTLQDIYSFIDTLQIPDNIKTELKKITPENYIGLAEKLADY